MAKGKKTGGRTAGTPNADKAPIRAKAEELGVDPVEAMLELTAYYFKEWEVTRDSDMAKKVCDYASQAAPYVRPRLAAIAPATIKNGKIVLEWQMDSSE